MTMQAQDIWTIYNEACLPLFEAEEELQYIYKYLFGLYFVSVSGIHTVDETLRQRGHLPAREEDRDNYQKYDLCGLDYFYLRSDVHVERLSDEEQKLLAQCRKQQEDDELFQKALKMVERTFREVLPVHPEKKDEWFELFKSIHGEGRVKGGDIVFAIKTSPQYDENGMVVSWEEEERKDAEILRVVVQLEPILSGVLAADVRIIIKDSFCIGG